MNIEQLVKRYGDDNVAIGREICYTPQSIRNWRRKGKIPMVAQRTIEAITGGALKADKKPKRVRA